MSNHMRNLNSIQKIEKDSFYIEILSNYFEILDAIDNLNKYFKKNEMKIE